MAWNSGHRSGNQKIHVLFSSLSQLTLSQVAVAEAQFSVGNFTPAHEDIVVKICCSLRKEKTKDKNSLHHHQATELVSSLPATRIIGSFQEEILPAACGTPQDEWEFFLSVQNCLRGANKATLVSFGVTYMNEIVVISVESRAASAQRSTACSFVCHIVVSIGQLMHPSSLQSCSSD